MAQPPSAPPSMGFTTELFGAPLWIFGVATAGLLLCLTCCLVALACCLCIQCGKLKTLRTRLQNAQAQILPLTTEAVPPTTAVPSAVTGSPELSLAQHSDAVKEQRDKEHVERLVRGSCLAFATATAEALAQLEDRVKHVEQEQQRSATRAPAPRPRCQPRRSSDNTDMGVTDHEVGNQKDASMPGSGQMTACPECKNISCLQCTIKSHVLDKEAYFRVTTCAVCGFSDEPEQVNPGSSLPSFTAATLRPSPLQPSVLSPLVPQQLPPLSLHAPPRPAAS